MKLASTAFALVALLVSARAEDPKLKIEYKPAVGQKRTLTFDLHMSIGDADAVVSGTSETTVDKAGTEKTEVTTDWPKFNVSMNGNDTQVPFEPFKIALGPDGEPLSLTGGIQGADNERTYLVTHFPVPNKDLAKGESTTLDLPSKGNLPARKVTETFLGSETISGKEASKVHVVLEEVGGEHLKVESNFWVLKDSTVLKQEGTFSNLPVPIANASASGSIKTSGTS